MIDTEKEIEKAILHQPIDLQLLRNLSRRKGGFQNNKLRVRVWPKLMDVNRYNIDDFRQEIDPHKDDSQILVDVERSLWDIEIIKNWRDSYRDRRRKALSDIIMSILSRNKGLHYYQGFHDVVSVFLLVFQDDHLAFAVSEKVALSFMIDFMQKDFELVCQFMKIVLLIIQSADAELHNHFVAANMEPFFTTSWLLTWFSHDLKDLESIARLFDTLLSSPPIYIYYLSAAYVIHLRKELLETEPDFAMMHSTLARAPEKFGFPIEDLILAADKLMALVTVEMLKSLSDKKLLRLINSKKIMSIARPCFTKNSTDTDWCLLEHMRLVPDKSNSWGIPNSAFRTLWAHGWNLTFLTPHRLRTLEQHRQHIEGAASRGAEKHSTDQEVSSSPKPVPLSQRHSVLDVVCGAIDDLMYFMFIQFRQLRNGQLFLKMDHRRYPSWRIGLFWSITVAVSGTIVYSMWNHHSMHSFHSTSSECPAPV